MAKKKSREELEAEIKYLRESRIAESITSVINSFIKTIGMLAIPYFTFRSIEVLAGRTTDANIQVNLLPKLFSKESLLNLYNLVILLIIFFGICGIIYGVWQRKLRQDTIERLQKRNQELELKLDPNRSTSMLTNRGETRKEDL